LFAGDTVESSISMQQFPDISKKIMAD